MSSLCTTNYFSKHVSIIILCLLRGGRLYIAVLYNIFSSIFFLPVPEKKKNSLKKETTYSPLSFIEQHLAEFVTLHQFLTVFP